MKIVYEVIGNSTNKLKNLPEKAVINNTTAKEKQETEINKYLANIGPNLASKILNEQRGLEKYSANCNTVMNNAPINNEELRNAFFYSVVSNYLKSQVSNHYSVNFLEKGRVI